MRLRVLVSMALVSCATSPAPAPATPVAVAHPAAEGHLSSLRQLTFGGENAEAYWSFDGQGVSLQRRGPDDGCDRIYTMPLLGPTASSPPTMTQVSSGQGATTCAHYLPDGDVVFASTHLAGAACPPKPDMRLGYVWAIYGSYDIFRTRPDGTGLTRLTETPGYDAEATVCGKDGSIVFTSVRDGDLELYRMDADGKNVKRLTHTPGYDGGAFFNADCSKLVWRASRPAPGKALDEYQALLGQGLVRPSKLELWVSNADGTDAHQVTYLDAASFAPFFYPDGKRLIFSSNYGDPKGREFDLFAINIDGTELERITHTPGFDGFPMFSPDGRHLIFASNRATAAGQSDTNLFLARWEKGDISALGHGAAERVRDDVRWFADPERGGRGIGTQGLALSGEHLEEQFRALGLSPAGDAEGYRHRFEVTTKVTATSATALKVGGVAVKKDAFVAMGWSNQGTVKGKAVLVGYGLEDAELGFDDYKGKNVKGKVAVALRFAPESEKLTTPESQRRAGDLRRKAFVARSRGATALLVVDWPLSVASMGGAKALPPEATLPTLLPEGTGEAGLPVVVVKRDALAAVMDKLRLNKPVDVQLTVALAFEKSKAFNVVGRLPAGQPNGSGAVVIGAHYDHLGLGGPNSLAPDKTEPHLGADDNASGVAALLEVARALSETKGQLARDVVFVAFSGEESGVLGSAALVRSKPAWLGGAVAMLNMDMVGRLRSGQLTVLGGATATEWSGLVKTACEAHKLTCTATGDGYGPSDHTAFYAAGLPVLHFFTGAHGDYHKPTDEPSKLNAGGLARVSEVVADVALAAMTTPLTFQKVAAPAPRGDARSFNASLGTIPNYAGAAGVKGVLLDDVRPGGGADKAGMKRGDVIIKLGTVVIGSVEDLMFVLMQAKPGETVTAVVLRDGQEMRLETTYQEGRKR